MSKIKAIETRYKGYRFRSKHKIAEPRKTMAKQVDYTGKRFGRCVAVECLGIANSGYRWWGCLCDCGERFAVRSRELTRVHTQSCGCLQRESAVSRAGQNKLPYGHASRNELLGSYKKSAFTRGLEWNISSEVFFDMVSSNCKYCGSQPDSLRKPNAGVNGEFYYSGIDRVDNAFGYIIGNVVSCCWNCNRAKGRLTITQFMEWIDRLTAAKSARFEFSE